MTSVPDEPVGSVEAAVKHCYSTWGDKYYKDYYGPDAPYPPVHLDLVRRLVDRVGARRILDAGCGPASMMRHLTGAGRAVYGFDLTPEMVTEARRVMAELGTAPERVWEGSVLAQDTFIPPGEARPDFDCIVCCGVLPHIPKSQDAVCIANIHEALAPGGYAMVEARNELFSLFTLNRYSHQLFLERLIPMERLWETVGDEREGFEQALRQVENMFRTDSPPIRKGNQSEPGYDEVLSRVHNPLELREQFRHAGFDDVRLFFYHFHCLPPMVGGFVPKLFRQASLAMESDPENWRGLVMASAFFIMGRRS